MSTEKRDDPVRLAESQQGGERYCGVDRYQKTVLTVGTRLVKLEPPLPKVSTSGYFMPYEEYQVRGNAHALAEGVQVAPHVKTIHGQRSYKYYPEVSVWRVEKPIEAAIGPTRANPQYGEGGLTQLHIADFRGGEPEHNKRLGLAEAPREALNNTGLDNTRGERIDEHLEHHQRVRNQFCHLDQLNELRRLTETVSDPPTQTEIDKLQAELSEKSARYSERIQNTPAELRIPCPSFDAAIRHLSQGPQLSAAPPLAEQITRLRENLMSKVTESIHRVVCGDIPYERRNEKIHVDELRQAYQCHQFIRQTRVIVDLKQNSQQIHLLERELGQLENRKAALLQRGKFCNVLEDPAERIAEIKSELSRVNEQGQVLRGELRICEQKAAEFQNFLSLDQQKSLSMRF